MIRWRFTSRGDIFRVTLSRKCGAWHYWIADNGFEFKTNGLKGAETPQGALRAMCWSLCLKYFDPDKDLDADVFRDSLLLAMKAFDKARAIVAAEQGKLRQCCLGDGI